MIELSDAVVIERNNPIPIVSKIKTTDSRTVVYRTKISTIVANNPDSLIAWSVANKMIMFTNRVVVECENLILRGSKIETANSLRVVDGLKITPIIRDDPNNSVSWSA